MFNGQSKCSRIRKTTVSKDIESINICNITTADCMFQINFMKYCDNKCSFLLKTKIHDLNFKLRNPKAYKSKDLEINITVPLLSEE